MGDMREDGPLLSNQEVEAQEDGLYIATIAHVEREEISSKFTGKTLRWVVTFADSTRYIPGKHARRDLIRLLGSESTDWHGETITIGLRERRGQLEKFIIGTASATTEATEGEEDTITPAPRSMKEDDHAEKSYQ